eukprot:scaffold311_cov173-Amphora_coffeaeformis.AAC.11
MKRYIAPHFFALLIGGATYAFVVWSHVSWKRCCHVNFQVERIQDVLYLTRVYQKNHHSFPTMVVAVVRNTVGSPMFTFSRDPSHCKRLYDPLSPKPRVITALYLTKMPSTCNVSEPILVWLVEIIKAH